MPQKVHRKWLRKKMGLSMMCLAFKVWFISAALKVVTCTQSLAKAQILCAGVRVSRTVCVIN